ncbi:uncharacterized protein BT62DRAFT_939218, partial [Guyanagaster necrorhizus]
MASSPRRCQRELPLLNSRGSHMRIRASQRRFAKLQRELVQHYFPAEHLGWRGPRNCSLSN